MTPVVGGLVDPLRVTNAGDGSGRLFIVEKRGVIRMVRDGELVTKPFLDIAGRVRDNDFEQGLFSVAFHPNFAENGYFYVVYTSEPEGSNVLARFSVSPSDPDVALPASELRLFDIPDEAANHNGGDLAFSPLDGYLYYATGDGGGPGAIHRNAQDPQSLFGKVLRVDVDGGTPYAIPDDNPFVDDDDYLAEIWATGLRNPWRFSFDRLTGDLYIGDVGQSSWEELNYQPAGSAGGQNYGWPDMEGLHCYPAGTACDEDGLWLPVLEYPQYDSAGEMIGCSIAAGAVYRGSATPGAYGALLYGDWCSGRLFLGYQTSNGAWASRELANTGFQVTSIGEDEAGELYLTDMLGGALYRLELSAPNPTPIVDLLEPAGIVAGSGETELAVMGYWFGPDSNVLVDGDGVPTQYVSPTLLRATLPASATESAGVLSITVSSPEPGGGESEPWSLAVLDGAAAESAFARTWARTDAPVASGAAARTWIWGPEPFTEQVIEPYAYAPGGQRIVQYFDKSRMELTDPNADSGTPWYVTNGLLVREMMTGELQVGDADFERREPADVNAAGDPDDPDGITYATLAELVELPAHAPGQAITAVLDAGGTIRNDPGLAGQAVTAAELSPETGHRTASVFWDFMRSGGLVEVDGELVEEVLFPNPYYGTGLPVTEAYWARIDVGGVEHLVLIQAFERRVLTYTPDNPAGWRVEAGNVGLHYYSWRYGK
jgi:glucose/arabinose dehydrogenase